MSGSVSRTAIIGAIMKKDLREFTRDKLWVILSALGLVTPEFLRSKRRHAIVAITVAASFLTPGDVITLTIMLMVPLFFLYEFSIYLSRLIWRRKRAREREEEAHRDQEASGETEEDGKPDQEPSGESYGVEDRSREIRETPTTTPEEDAEAERKDSGSVPDSEEGT